MGVDQQVPDLQQQPRRRSGNPVEHRRHCQHTVHTRRRTPAHHAPIRRRRMGRITYQRLRLEWQQLQHLLGSMRCLDRRRSELARTHQRNSLGHRLRHLCRRESLRISNANRRQMGRHAERHSNPDRGLPGRQPRLGDQCQPRRPLLEWKQVCPESYASLRYLDCRGSGFAWTHLRNSVDHWLRHLCRRESLRISNANRRRLGSFAEQRSNPDRGLPGGQPRLGDQSQQRCPLLEWKRFCPESYASLRYLDCHGSGFAWTHLRNSVDHWLRHLCRRESLRISNANRRRLGQHAERRRNPHRGFAGGQPRLGALDPAALTLYSGKPWFAGSKLDNGPGTYSTFLGPSNPAAVNFVVWCLLCAQGPLWLPRATTEDFAGHARAKTPANRKIKSQV